MSSSPTRARRARGRARGCLVDDASRARRAGEASGDDGGRDSFSGQMRRDRRFFYDVVHPRARFSRLGEESSCTIFLANSFPSSSAERPRASLSSRSRRRRATTRAESQSAATARRHAATRPTTGIHRSGLSASATRVDLALSMAPPRVMPSSSAAPSSAASTRATPRRPRRRRRAADARTPAFAQKKGYRVLQRDFCRASRAPHRSSSRVRPRRVRRARGDALEARRQSDFAAALRRRHRRRLHPCTRE